MYGELTPSQIDALLHDQWVARLGMHASRLTYVVPISYVYDGESIFGHSTAGLKLEMLRANPKVCVEVDRVDAPGTWQSVIAWGTFEELADEQAFIALEKILARFTPMMTSPAATPTHGAFPSPHEHRGALRGAVYRIVLDEKSGRFEHPGS